LQVVRGGRGEQAEDAAARRLRVQQGDGGGVAERAATGTNRFRHGAEDAEVLRRVRGAGDGHTTEPERVGLLHVPSAPAGEVPVQDPQQRRQSDDQQEPVLDVDRPHGETRTDVRSVQRGRDGGGEVDSVLRTPAELQEPAAKQGHPVEFLSRALVPRFMRCFQRGQRRVQLHLSQVGRTVFEHEVAHNAGGVQLVTGGLHSGEQRRLRRQFRRIGPVVQSSKDSGVLLEDHEGDHAVVVGDRESNRHSGERPRDAPRRVSLEDRRFFHGRLHRDQTQGSVRTSEQRVHEHLQVFLPVSSPPIVDFLVTVVFAARRTKI
jgi:hypothetical protein